MEVEISNFIKVWFSVVVSLCYCYAIGKIVQKGITRLFYIIPIVCLFLYLPPKIKSMHLRGFTSFFISWLTNFKLLLFVFGKGPLSVDPPISLAKFVAVASLPIKIQQNPSPKKPQENTQNKEENPSTKKHKEGHKRIYYAIKVVLFCIVVCVCSYKEYFHSKVIIGLYSLQIYLILDIILAMMAYLARTMHGLELEPQFNKPYLSTSLQDFWGKRWNLMVTNILRPTVYKPNLYIFTRVMDRKWAPVPAVLCTFLVSAFMHEVVIYHAGQVGPTWVITWFFILHGLCLAVEIVLKKALRGRWLFPSLISRPLTVGFVMATSFWLFVPELVRCNIFARAYEEYAAMGAFMENFM